MQLTLIEAKEQGRPRSTDDAPAVERPPVRAAEYAAIEFGRFHVLLRQRKLLAGGVPIELGTRAFDVLMVLIEADGSLVTRDELLTRVWPGIVVVPDNLKVQVCALRNALGEDRDLIRTEFGRGYRFTAAVRGSTATDPRAPSAADAMEARGRREVTLTMELAALATQLAELEEKLAAAAQMLNGRAQNEEARFHRRNYCVRSLDHANRQKHVRLRRRAR
jgi:DNA-binding winged helix-turn-helix (wHTH) protein